MNLSRRNFIVSGFWLFTGLVMGRASSELEVNASHPPDYERAPLPDLAGEITTDECLTRDQIERVTEMALERACPVELSAEEELRLRMAQRMINPPMIMFRGAPVIEDVNLDPGKIYFLSKNERIADYPNFIETWNPETRP